MEKLFVVPVTSRLSKNILNTPLQEEKVMIINFGKHFGTSSLSVCLYVVSRLEEARQKQVGL